MVFFVFLTVTLTLTLTRNGLCGQWILSVEKLWLLSVLISAYYFRLPKPFVKILRLTWFFSVARGNWFWMTLWNMKSERKDLQKKRVLAQGQNKFSSGEKKKNPLGPKVGGNNWKRWRRKKLYKREIWIWKRKKNVKNNKYEREGKYEREWITWKSRRMWKWKKNLKEKEEYEKEWITWKRGRM